MATTPDDQPLRERALERLRTKRDLLAHFVMYLMVNALLVAIWATVGGRGFFWPMFPLAGWGIGLVFQAWAIYAGEPTEDQIRREMDRLR